MYFFKLLFLLPYDTCIISILSQGISKELDIFYELTIYRVYFFGRVPFEFVILLSILTLSLWIYCLYSNLILLLYCLIVFKGLIIILEIWLVDVIGLGLG